MFAMDHKIYQMGKAIRIGFSEMNLLFSRLSDELENG